MTVKTIIIKIHGDEPTKFVFFNYDQHTESLKIRYNWDNDSVGSKLYKCDILGEEDLIDKLRQGIRTCFSYIATYNKHKSTKEKILYPFKSITVIINGNRKNAVIDVSLKNEYPKGTFLLFRYNGQVRKQILMNEYIKNYQLYHVDVIAEHLTNVLMQFIKESCYENRTRN